MKSFSPVGPEVLDRRPAYQGIKKHISPPVENPLYYLLYEDRLFTAIKREVKERAVYGDTHFVA